MLPFAIDLSLNEWGRALCAADFRPKTFVSERDNLAQKDLLDQADVTAPRNIRNGRTRNYAEDICQEPRIQIGACDIHSTVRIMPPTFVYEELCLHAALLSTTALAGCADYWVGLIPPIERFEFPRFRPLGEYGMEMVAILMYRTSSSRLFDATYSLRPRIVKFASLVCMQIGARPPLSPPGDWRVSRVRRQFAHPDHVLAAIRSILSPSVPLSENWFTAPECVASDSTRANSTSAESPNAQYRTTSTFRGEQTSATLRIHRARLRGRTSLNSDFAELHRPNINGYLPPRGRYSIEDAFSTRSDPPIFTFRKGEGAGARCPNPPNRPFL